MDVVDGVAYDAPGSVACGYRYTTQMRLGATPPLYLASNSLRKIKEAIKAAGWASRWITRNDGKEFVISGRGGRQVLFDEWHYRPRH